MHIGYFGSFWDLRNVETLWALVVAVLGPSAGKDTLGIGMGRIFISYSSAEHARKWIPRIPLPCYFPPNPRAYRFFVGKRGEF